MDTPPIAERQRTTTNMSLESLETQAVTDALNRRLKALRRQAKSENNKQPQRVHRIIEITTPVPVADDTYHALKKGIPPIGSFLLSLPEYTGRDVVDCQFYFPQVGIVTVPGLNSPVFRTQAVPSYTAAVRSSGWDIIRLPNIYVLLNRCMTALWKEKQDENNLKRFGQVTDSRPYDWGRAGAEIRREAAGLGARILDTHALRIRQGAGFMALAQANGNLTRAEVGIGLELAKEILANFQAEEHAERHNEIEDAKHRSKTVAMRYNTVSDIAGCKLTVVCRFPATTSESVRLDMHMVLSGRGRCCYLNPDVLKTGMEGDVDGDLIFAETDSLLRKVSEYRAIVPLPNVVSHENFLSDFSLGDCFGCDEEDKPLFLYDDYKVYQGMDGKNGIGEATNLFYRGVNILHIQFMGSKETRKEFWDFVGRPDLKARMPKTRNEETLQQWFRYLSALTLMDSIHPIYEGLFDLRKDDSVRPYLLHFLSAVRGQEQMDFDYLSEMKVKGEAIDVRAIELMWHAAQVGERIGQPTSFVRQYKIVNMFFQGNKLSEGKKTHMGEIMETLDAMGVEDQAKYIFDELDGVHPATLMLDNEEDMDMSLEGG